MSPYRFALAATVSTVLLAASVPGQPGQVTQDTAAREWTVRPEAWSRPVHSGQRPRQKPRDESGLRSGDVPGVGSQKERPVTGERVSGTAEQPEVHGAGPGRSLLVYPDMPMHPNPGHHQTELTAAVHPGDPNILFSGSNSAALDLSVLSQGWYLTSDGGQTWGGGDTLPTHTDLGRFWTDPAVAIDRTGILYLNAIEFGGGADLYVARSTDHGVTWSQVAVPDPRAGEDKNHLTVDVNPGSPHADNVYTAYTDFAGRSPWPVVCSRSTDRGLSFSVPVPISGSIGSGFAQGVNLAVGGEGEVYAAWSGYSEFPPDSTRLGFSRSLDGGLTWDTAQAIRWVQDIRGFLSKGGDEIRVNSYPALAVDRGAGPRAGWIYLVFAEKSPVRPDVYLIRSTDRGQTWTSPRRVHHDSATGDQWFPWVAADPTTGGLFVVYYDSRRFELNDSAEVWLSYSFDGGDTFEDLRVSDVPFQPAPIAGLADGYMGDYIDIEALDGVVWPVWNDDRSGVHQAYTARIEIVDLGAPARIETTPAALDFDSVFIGYRGMRTLTLRNPSFPDTLQILGISSSDPAYRTGAFPSFLPGGGLARVDVTFEPTAPGPVQDVLVIQTSDAVRPLDTIPLAGQGVWPPLFSVAPPDLMDTLTHGDSAHTSLVITNSGPGDLYYSIRVEPTAVPPILPGGEGGTRARAWGKTDTGGSTPARLRLATSDLVASDQGPDLRRDPSIRPPGDLPLIVQDPAGDASLVDVAALRAVIHLDTLTVQLEFFTPIDPLDFGGYLSFDVDQDVTTGDPPFFGSSGQDIGADIEFAFFNLDENFVIMEEATTGDDLDTFAVVVDTASLRFSLPIWKLDTDGFLDVTGVFGNGDGPTDWIPDLGHGTIAGPPFLTVDTSTTRVPPGGDTTVTVALNARSLFGGRYERQIRIRTNDPAQPLATVPLGLEVVGTPVLLVADTIQLDSAFVGFPETTGVAVNSAGTDQLDLRGFTSDDARVRILVDSLHIPAGRTADLPLEYAPLVALPLDATIAFATNDPDEPAASIRVLGQGVLAPQLELIPDRFELGIHRGDTSWLRADLVNAGEGVLIWTASSPPFYPMVSVAPQTGVVPPGDTAELQIRIESAALPDGLHELDVTVQSNDPRAPTRAIELAIEVIGIRPGDANTDFVVDVRDIITLTGVIFRGAAEPPPGAGDPDCDGGVTLGDLLYLIEYIFLGGPAPNCDVPKSG